MKTLAILSRKGGSGKSTFPVGRQQSPSRVGKKPVTVYYGKEAHLQLKILAAENETTIQDLHEDALNALFVKHGKPPIA